MTEEEILLELLLERNNARNNLLDFTKYTFPEFEAAKHHDLIASKLQEVEEKVRQGKGARLMIFTPPRHTKSELASRRFPAWTLGRNPSWQIITATYAMDFAADFGRDVRHIVKSNEYRHLFPEVELSQDVKAAARWNTNQGGVYVAAGVGGPLTGRGAHIALIDDPFKDWMSAFSEATREHIWKWYLTVLRTRLMPGGAIVLIMTRWHDDDIAGRLIAQQEKGGDQWDIIELPALIETEQEEKKDPLGRKIGDPLWPEWFSEEELLKTKAVMPTYEWSALYQQKPVPDEGDYFQYSWFRWYDKLPEHLNFYICYDGGTQNNEGDPTEIGVFGVDPKDNIYIVDWWGGQKTTDIWIDQLIDFADKYKPFVVVGEGGIMRRSVEPFLAKRKEQRKVYFREEYLPSIGDKPLRARQFQALCSMGKVYLPDKAPWVPDLISQLLRFPSGVYDDKVDACGLMGRAINQTWKPKVPKVSKKLPIDAKPTWNDIFNEFRR